MFRIPNTDLPVPPERIGPVDLVPLAALATEGFGYGSPFVTTPQDAVDALAAEFGDHVTLDDIGRRCVTRSTACRLFTERAEAERRQHEAHERHEAELAEQAGQQSRPSRHPARLDPDGVSPASARLQAARDAEPRRGSVLEESLANPG